MTQIVLLQTVLVGLGAGTAAALLFASVTSGLILSVFLFYLAPLPIMIAAQGWSHWAGLVAAMTAAACLGIAFGFLFFLAFLTGVAIPAWWLGYLSLLGRSATNGGGDHLEWYPPGRLVLWTAILGALIVTIALASFGGDEQTIRASLHTALDRIFRLQFGIEADGPLRLPGFEDPERMIDLFTIALPPIAAVIATLTQALNLWLSGHIVKLSGRLKRPWPDLSTMSFPPAAAALLPIAGAGALIPDVPGMISSLFAATLTVAFAILGFAVLHAMVRRVTGPLAIRVALLTGAYALVAILGWPALIVVLIGLFETLFGWRARMDKRGPPAVPGG
jgi:Predicted membrane protein (DUF2232)